MPRCDQCGRRVGRGYQCEDCGGTYCADHRTPVLHGCREGARGGDPRGSDDETGEDDTTASFETLVVLASAAAVAVFLLVGAVAVGVVSPSDVIHGRPLGGGRATTTHAVQEPFDEAAFRRQVLSAVNERRQALGTGALSVDERRQVVAERMAEDMARDDYFENATAHDSSLFSAERRLAAANRSCEGGPLASYFMKTYYGKPIRTDDGVEFYSSTDEVAESAASQMVDDIASIDRKSSFDAHALGVHETGDGSVYVVYVAC